MNAWINLNGNEYFIAWYGDRFGAAAGIGQKMKYMRVKDNFENCYKLFKTLVYAHGGARGAYNWLVLTAQYRTRMDLAEKFVQHIIKNGRGLK